MSAQYPLDPGRGVHPPVYTRASMLRLSGTASVLGSTWVIQALATSPAVDVASHAVAVPAVIWILGEIARIGLKELRYWINRAFPRIQVNQVNYINYTSYPDGATGPESYRDGAPMRGSHERG